jgi:hypothetical protein
MANKVSLLITGCLSAEELAKELKRLSNWYSKFATPPKAGKAKPKDEDEEEEDEEESEDEADESEDENEEDESEDESDDSDDDEEDESEDEDDDEEEDEKPAKGKKGTKKKLTIEQVNEAAKAACKRDGWSRKKVLSILKKKFGTETLSDVPAAKWPDVIKALS